jgi:hypothetical protein
MKAFGKVISPLLVLIFGIVAWRWIGQAMTFTPIYLGALPAQQALWFGLAILTPLLMATVIPWRHHRTWLQHGCLLLLCMAVTLTILYPPDSQMHFGWVFNRYTCIDPDNYHVLLSWEVALGACLLHVITFPRTWLRSWWYIAAIVFFVIPIVNAVNSAGEKDAVDWDLIDRYNIILLATIPTFIVTWQVWDYVRSRSIRTPDLK